MNAREFKVRSATPDGRFEAVIATLGVVDRDGDVIAPGAFTGRPVYVLPSHDATAAPIGKARIEERGNQAVAVGELFMGSRQGAEWAAVLRHDLEMPPAIQEWSFSFDVPTGGSSRRGDGVRVLERVAEVEVSPVLRGAGIGTRTTCAGESCKGRCCCGDEKIAGSVRGAEAALAKADGEVGYVVIGWDQRLGDLAERTCRSWGIATPRLRMVREAEPGEKVALRHSGPINGLHAPGEVFVRQRPDWPGMVKTLGHELCHAWQHAKGRPASEPEAVEFGARFGRWAIYHRPDTPPRPGAE